MNETRSREIVANWLFLGVAMLVVQVLLGGITRLTGSGLSITEWEPVKGILPPLTEKAWLYWFEQYKQIGQYKYLNYHFTLHDFKFIFFWEWFHRVWARLLSIVFLVPFVFFIWKGYFKKWMLLPLVILFFLGGLQGLVGWIMVKSGLNKEDLYVNHIRLAVHFLAAMLLISYTFVFGLMLKIPKEKRVEQQKKLRISTIIIIGILSLQLMYGAFMAGLKAASAAPTWPTINGYLVPQVLLEERLNNILFFNKISIHFIHRGLAYLLLIILIGWWWKASKVESKLFSNIRNIVLSLVIFQVVLGISAVMTSTSIILGSFGIFEWIALFHQLIGMLLLLSLVSVVYVLKPSGLK